MFHSNNVHKVKKLNFIYEYIFGVVKLLFGIFFVFISFEVLEGELMIVTNQLFIVLSLTQHCGLSSFFSLYTYLRMCFSKDCLDFYLDPNLPSNSKPITLTNAAVTSNLPKNRISSFFPQNFIYSYLSHQKQI